MPTCYWQVVTMMTRLPRDNLFASYAAGSW